MKNFKIFSVNCYYFFWLGNIFNSSKIKSFQLLLTMRLHFLRILYHNALSCKIIKAQVVEICPKIWLEGEISMAKLGNFSISRTNK